MTCLGWGDDESVSLVLKIEVVKFVDSHCEKWMLRV